MGRLTAPLPAGRQLAKYYSYACAVPNFLANEHAGFRFIPYIPEKTYEMSRDPRKDLVDVPRYVFLPAYCGPFAFKPRTVPRFCLYPVRLKM